MNIKSFRKPLVSLCQSCLIVLISSCMVLGGTSLFKSNYNYYSLQPWTNQQLGQESMSFAGIVCLQDGLQLSIDTSGFVKVLPQMLLANKTINPAEYTVKINNKNTDTVTCSSVGLKIKMSVFQNGTSNSCWTWVLIEDKIGPTVTCRDTAVLCSGNLSAIDSIPGLVFIKDNCTPFAQLTINHIDKIKSLDCGNDTFSILTRRWIARDPWNRVGECTQRIGLLRAENSDIVWPRDTTIYCPNINTSIEKLGQPSINGAFLDKFCGWSVRYEDAEFAKCGITKKILRSWYVLNCCALADTVVEQFIVIADTTAPVVTCPLPLTVGTSPDLCVANFRLPPAFVFDSCHGRTAMTLIIVDTNQWVQPGAVIPLNLGLHSLMYEITDPCGNRSTCSTEVTVTDQQAPVILCDSVAPISLPTDLVRLTAEQMIDYCTVFDNCMLNSVMIRRTIDNCVDGIDNTIFNDTVTVCCSDVGQVFDFVFLAQDMGGNIDSCYVRALIQDKMAPQLDCAQDDTIFCNEARPAFIDPLLSLTDNCIDVVSVKIDTIYNSFNICGVGSIRRRIIATDLALNADTCIQTITSVLTDTLNPDDVTPHADTVKITGCSLGLIQKDSVGFVKPDVVLLPGGCNRVFFAFVDTVKATTGTSYCRITKRTWRVGDSCYSLTPVKIIDQIILQDTTDIPSPVAGPIIGKVINVAAQPIENVHVSGKDYSQSWSYSAMTDEHGVFNDPILKNIVTVKLEKAEKDELNGISTLDLLFIQAHILGNKVLTNPLDEYAADVDGNGNVNVLDLIALRKKILGTDDQMILPWYFTLGGQNLKYIQTGTRLADELPLIKDQTVPFIGFRMGDVNHDANINSIQGLESRQGGDGWEIDENGQLKVLVPMSLNGFQIALFAQEGWSGLQNIESSILKGIHYQVHGKILKINWYAAQAIQIRNSEILFQLRGAHPKNVSLSNDLRSEWYDADLNSQVLSIISTKNPVEVQVYPNPVVDNLQVRFENSKHTYTSWKLYNQIGRLVLDGSISGQPHQFSVGVNTLAEGMYVLELAAGPSGVTTRRKILVKK